MLTEFRKSINAILFERVSSPLFGTFTVSWLLWNWKIIYLTLFISEEKIDGNKIDFITDNFNNIHHLITFPLISTALLLTIIPFISNGAYWLSLKFKKWKTDKKNEVELAKLLTVEQSIALRKELRENEVEFEKILEKKEADEENLKTQIFELEGKIKDILNSKKVVRSSTSSYGSGDYELFKNNEKIYPTFQKVVDSIKQKGEFPEGISKENREYYLVNEIIQEGYDSFGDLHYELSSKGQNLYRDFFNDKFRTNN